MRSINYISDMFSSKYTVLEGALSASIAVLVLVLLSGCATMMNGSTKKVDVESEPSGAKVNVRGEIRGKTPLTVELDRSKTHLIRLEKEGYETHRVTFTNEENYIWFLNPLGVPVDFYTGAIYKFNRENVSAFLEEEEEKNVVSKDNVVAGKSNIENDKEKENDTKKEEKKYNSVIDNKVPKTDAKRDSDVAVVIGIKKYEDKDIPNVDYALRDARTMREYLVKTMGFREENIIFVENASGSDLTRIFGTAENEKGQLYNWVKSGESDVFMYYSGHGAPHPESGDAYLVPSGADPNYLSQNGYKLDQMYENLSQVPAQSITVTIEACFSGTSEEGNVVSDISPALLNVENPIVGIENSVVFSAGTAQQVSTWYNEKGHGLFTYHFLDGLRGKADTNGDKSITAEELGEYVTNKVSYQARRFHNREQTPQVVGQNKERVLVEYDNLPTDGE